MTAASAHPIRGGVAAKATGVLIVRRFSWLKIGPKFDSNVDLDRNRALPANRSRGQAR